MELKVELAMEGARSTPTATEPRHASALECHLCFKPPTDPVATSCGHVFCWPCMHHWFHDSPNEKPCPACRTLLNLDLSILTLYANSSGAPSGPTVATASQDNIIPGRPSIPITFIPAPIIAGFLWGPDVSGAEKVIVVLEVLQQKVITSRGELSAFYSGADNVPRWLVELLQSKPGHKSKKEKRMKQEVKDLRRQYSTFTDELHQQLRVEKELEQQLAHRRQAREMRPRKKARVC